MTLASALVVGGSGFIGSALVARLVSEGTSVTCVVRPDSARARTHSLMAGVELASFDEFGALKQRRFDVAFNLASYGVNPSDRGPEQLIEGNVAVLARLLIAATNWSLRRVVHVGSCSEYAPANPPKLLGEDQPLAPTSTYGAAKAAATIYGTALAQQLGVELVTLRLFGTYGPGEAEHRLIPHLIDRLRRDERAEISSGEQCRDLTYVGDVVAALIAAAEAPALPSYRAYNVCSGVPVRIRDLAELVARLMRKPPELLGLGRARLRDGETAWLVGDPGQFRAAVAWKPRIGLEQGVQLTLDAAGVGQ
jgi:nucleoside-diphosphate-sugar epimerase